MTADLAAALDALEAKALDADKLSDGRRWSTTANDAAADGWVDGFTVNFGVDECFEPSHDLPHFKDYAAFMAAADPQTVAALVKVAKAAEGLHEEVEMAESVSICLPDRVPSLLMGEALAALREQLDA